MRPDNGKLYGSVEQGGSVQRLEEEALRRVAIGQNLADLSEQFDARADGQPGHIAEPVMVRKLYALAGIQRSRLGVAGFDPRAAISFDQASDKVTALAAPPHDSFVHEATGAQVNTRAIKFNFDNNGYGDDSPIEMFGLNLYIPDPNVGSAAGIDAPESSLASSLVVVSESGRATTQPDSYIAGETPIIAVRNTKTGDARIYLLLDAQRSEMPEDLTDSRAGLSRGSGPLITDSEAWVELPDGQVQRIVVLQGEELRNAAAEFADASSALQTGGIQQLDVTERAAVAQIRSAGSLWAGGSSPGWPGGR